MPVYEYFCPRCNADFELMRPLSQSSADAPCPSCGTTGRKLVSVFGSTVDKYTVKVPEKSAYRGKRSPIKPSLKKNTRRAKPAARKPVPGKRARR